MLERSMPNGMGLVTGSIQNEARESAGDLLLRRRCYRTAGG